MTIGAGIFASQLKKSAKLISTGGALDVDTTQTFDFSDLRGTLGADLAAAGFRITGLGAPTADGDAATKSYVDNLVNSLNWKDDVVAATAAALPACTYNNGSSGVGATLTKNSNGALTVDGITASNGMRILVKDQASALQNGIYVVTNAGSGGAAWVLTRATDFDGIDKIASAIVQVNAGTANGDHTFFTTANFPFTVGTDAIDWSTYGSTYSPGDGIAISSSTISVKLESSNPSLQFDTGELGLKIAGDGGLAKDASGVYVMTDNSTIEINGSGELQVKALGVVPGNLSWRLHNSELDNTDFSYGSGYSSATVDASFDATAVSWSPGMVRLTINGVELSMGGEMLTYVGGSAPSAEGQWRLNGGTTLEVYGDLTTTGIKVRVTYPISNS